MIITAFSWIKSERFWRFAIYALFCAGFLGGVFIGSLLIFPRIDPAEAVLKGALSQEGGEKDKTYCAITAGPLSLNESEASAFLPYLLQELQYVGYQIPSSDCQEGKMLIRLKSAGAEKIVSQGAPFFLAYVGGEEAPRKIVGFSEDKTDLRLIPIALTANQAQVEVEFGEAFFEKASKEEIFLDRSALIDKEAPYYQEIKEAKWWGVDEFIRLYGGADYTLIKNKHKLEFFREKEAYICYVAQGATLVWGEGRWREQKDQESLQGKPFVVIRSISTNKLEMEGCEETGFHPFKINLLPESAAQNTPLKMDHLPISIRMRNGSQISCILNKRRIILTKGDWILHTANGWRILKRSDEIDQYLNHQLRGEMFVFDNLENQGGKTVVRGYLFDEMRTQKQLLTIPISSERKVRKKQSKVSSR